MEKTKLLGELANDLIQANDAQIRTLDDLEMASAAGGDGVVVWVSPPTGP